jgi:ligand-binding sensor domain-containing protein
MQCRGVQHRGGPSEAADGVAPAATNNVSTTCRNAMRKVISSRKNVLRTAEPRARLFTRLPEKSRGPINSPICRNLRGVGIVAVGGVMERNAVRTTFALLCVAACVCAVPDAYAQEKSRVVTTTVNAPDPEAQISGVVRRIFQDKRGTLWFGTEDGLCRYDGTSFTYCEDEPGRGGTIKTIAEDREGNIWCGTTGGVSKYDGKSFTYFTEKDGLVSNDVWSMTIDGKGTIWIGTLEGVSRFDGKTFTPFAIPEAEPDPSRGVTSARIVHCIVEDSRGRMWFGTNGGAYIFDGTSLSNISANDGLSNNNVGCILEDKDGNIWLGTTHGGLCRYDGESFVNICEQAGLDATEVWDVCKDRAGNIWFSGKHFGVYRQDGNAFAHFSRDDGLASNGIMAILEDSEGRIWCGGVSGLFRLDGKRFVNVTKNGPWQ